MRFIRRPTGTNRKILKCARRWCEMGVLWYKIWFDIWHNKTRTLLAVLSIAAGVFAVGAIFGMSELMITNMDQSHQAVMPPHIDVILSSEADGDTLKNLTSIPGVEGIE